MAWSLLHQDAFTAADGTNLDGRTMTDGVGVFTAFGGAWEVNGNAGRETSGAGGGSADQYIYDSAMSDVDIQKCEFTTITARDVGPMTRFASSGPNGYLAYVSFLDGTVAVYRLTAGAFTALGSPGGPAAANDVVSLESDGSDHIGRINGTSVSTASDSNHATGKAAIYSGGLGNQHFDDFADYTEAASTDKPVADTGSGSEAAAVGAAVPIADTGTGSESVGVGAAAPVADTATGGEGVVVYVSIDVGDAGSGLEAAAGGAGATIGDAGAGVDGIDVAAAVGLADAGAGTDSLGIGADLGVGDTSTGVDALSGGAGAEIGDAGAGAEGVLVAVAAGVGDAAAGADSPGLAAALGVSDSGLGFDDPSVPESSPPYNTPARTARLRGTISRAARLRGGARIARPDPPED